MNDLRCASRSETRAPRGAVTLAGLRSRWNDSAWLRSSSGGADARRG